MRGLMMDLLRVLAIILTTAFLFWSMVWFDTWLWRAIKKRYGWAPSAIVATCGTMLIFCPTWSLILFLSREISARYF